MSEQLKVTSSILDLAPKDAMTWSVARHRNFLAAAGYDGTTYYPLNNRLTAEMLAGRKAGDVISAFQQSWREQSRLRIVGQQLAQLLGGRSKAAAVDAAREVGMAFAMPVLERNLAVIGRLQKRLGTDALRPIVAHPHGQMFGKQNSSHGERRQYRELAASGRVGELQWQPTIELAHTRGITTRDATLLTDRLVASVQGDGFGRAAFDTNNAAMERNGDRFPDPEAVAARLAETGQLGSFEFSIQPQFGGNIDHLRSVMDGNIGDTPQGKMLTAAYQALPRDAEVPPIRVEIPQYAFAGIDLDYQQGHQELVPMLREYAAGALATR